ncbi:c-type cytochrome [Pacificoceanicola onchidii]|uniref:c-type cytochrome n=1 Tax=Pacificoceanicola onchidii TaxID=2562685 RepID=UPI0010A3A88C|nr:cytochrome c [Pacificoceanicola onchidii]
MNKAKKQVGLFLIAACLGSVALAHGGVTNPAVMARMEAMKSTGDAMKVLGTMAKGARAFDAAEARAAAADVARFAAQTPALFEAPEDDPKAEALPAIWERFEDFTAKAQETEALALALSRSLQTEDDLKAGLMQLGASCKACHSEYRK